MKLELAQSVIGCELNEIKNTCIGCQYNQNPTKCNEYRAEAGFIFVIGIPELLEF
jgi:hypothetical protein